MTRGKPVTCLVASLLLASAAHAQRKAEATTLLADSLTRRAESAFVRDNLSVRAQLLSRAASLYEEAARPGAQMEALEGLGAVYLEMGRSDSALRALERARRAGERAAIGPDLAPTYVLIGTVERVAGRDSLAARRYRQAIGLLRSAHLDTVRVTGPRGRYNWEPERVYADALRQLAAMERDRRPDSALAMLRFVLGAMPSASTMIVIGPAPQRNEHPLFFVLCTAMPHRQWCEKKDALRALAGELARHRWLGDAEGEIASLLQIAHAYETVDRADSAKAFLSQAASLQRALDDSAGASHSEARLKALLANDNHPGPSRVDGVLHLRATEQSLPARLLRGAWAAEERNEWSEADAQYERARQAAQVADDSRLQVVALRGRARVLVAMARAKEAIELIKSAANVIDEKGASAAGSTEPLALGVEKAFALADIASFYHRALPHPDLARATAYYDTASIEILRALSSSGSDDNRVALAERSAALHGEWALAWLAREGEFERREVVRAALGAAEQGRAQGLRLARGSQSSIDPFLREFQPLGSEIGRNIPSVPEGVRWTKHAVLSYLLTPDTLLAWMELNGYDLTLVRTPVDRDSVTTWINVVREDIDRGIKPRARRSASIGIEGARAFAMLAKLLLPDSIRAHLPDSGEVTIVASGFLNEIPFAALPLDSGAALGLRYALRYLPSLFLLGDSASRSVGALPLTAQQSHLRNDPVVLDAAGSRLLGTSPAFTISSREREAANRARTAFLKRALVVADPITRTAMTPNGLDSLPGALGEGKAVALRLGVTLLSRDRATETAVRRRLSQSTIIHLATHGLAFSDPTLARQSFIAFSQDARNDGLLTVSDLLNDTGLTIHADLVVLSACQTALGAPTLAEGTVGLQRAFIARGARSILVSLWNVLDNATLLMMKRFYFHWLDDDDGPSKPEALRRAQVDVQRVFPHPRAWAAFQLVGVD